MGLIADIQNDMEKGAVRLIAEYRSRLVSEAHRICENASDVEDLVSRTLVKVISNIESHDESCDFYAWMRSIMVNLHRNDLAHPVARGTVPVDDATLEKCAGSDWSTDEQVLANSDRDALREAINQLDPADRHALSMYYMSDLTLKEIASFLNTSTSSVSRRLQVARRILAAKLGKQMGKKPFAVLLAALLGIGSLFGAWQAGLLEPLLSQITDTARSGEAESFPLQEETETFPLQEETFQGGEAVASGEAESFPLQEETTSTQLQSQSETDLTQDESQSETKEEQTMNLKTVKAVAASAAILAGTLGATAEEQGYWTYDATAKTISDGVWVLNVTESKGELTIKSVAAGTDYRSGMEADLSKPVGSGQTIVALGDGAFNGFGNQIGANLTVMKLPETLQTIGADAFKSCSKLTTVTPFMPASVTSVGQQAFWECGVTGDLVLGEEDGLELTLSGVRSFCNTKITSVTIEAPLKNGTLPASFGACSSLTNVVLRGNVTTLSSGAFSSCTKLADFYVSSFVTSWPADAISGPAAYKMRLWVDKTNPEWKNWIADDTKVLSWDGLDGATKAIYDTNFGTDAPRPVGLVTGDGVQPASQWVMLWDKGGEPVLWPMEVKATGYEGLVDGHPHNITVTVTKPVGGVGCSYKWSIDGGATWSDGLPNLTEAGVYTVTCQVSAEGFETTEVSATVILHGAADDHWAYDEGAGTITDGVWVLKVTESKGKLTVTGVAAGTDYRPDMTLDLAKPIDGDREIVALGGSAFSGFGNNIGKCLTAVRFPETLQSIGGDAFKSCSKLATVTPFLPASVTSVGNQAFWDCTSLTGDLVLGQVGGSSLTFGAYRIFNGTKISSAKFDSAIGGGTLPNGIFGGCKSLTNAVLRAGVTTISASAFASCTKLADLYLGAYVTSWADSAFSGATSEYGMRLWVDAYGKEWNDWVAANVTPWNKLDGDVQGVYYDNFGADAKRPVGLIAASGAQLPLQWLARWYPNGPKKGFMVILQ